jgi:hypothetical protein
MTQVTHGAIKLFQFPRMFGIPISGHSAASLRHGYASRRYSFSRGTAKTLKAA